MLILPLTPGSALGALRLTNGAVFSLVRAFGDCSASSLSRYYLSCTRRFSDGQQRFEDHSLNRVSPSVPPRVVRESIDCVGDLRECLVRRMVFCGAGAPDDVTWIQWIVHKPTPTTTYAG